MKNQNKERDHSEIARKVGITGLKLICALTLHLSHIVSERPSSTLSHPPHPLSFRFVYLHTHFSCRGHFKDEVWANQTALV